MRFLVRRIGFYLVAAWASLTLNFFLPRMMPGDPASAIFARFQGRLQPEQLNAQLMEAPAVEEATASGGQALGLRREGEETQGERSPDSGHAVRRDRSDRVVDPDALDHEDA